MLGSGVNVHVKAQESKLFRKRHNISETLSKMAKDQDATNNY